MRLARVFGDHAVMQRDLPLPVWGWTAPHRLVVVSLGAARAGGRSDEHGRFRCVLPPQPAGGPYTLEARAPAAGGRPEEAAAARDVMVGEVWIASGQSNMEMTLAATGEEPWRAAPLPDDVRMFTVPRVAAWGEADDVDAAWRRASDAGAATAFSAVAYHFAARLRRALGVAVGVLNASWGGTVVEAWTSRRTLVRNPDLAGTMEHYRALANDPAHWARMAEDGLLADTAGPVAAYARLCPPVPDNTGFADGWADPAFDDAAWGEMALPCQWNRHGHDTTGSFWFRRTVAVDPAGAGRDLLLELGAVDKQDVTYFNGEEVGRTGEGYDDTVWNVPRRYRVPGRLVKAGANVLAVRAYSFAFDGGLIGPVMRAWPGMADGDDVPPASSRAVDLSGPWRFRVECDCGKVAIGPQFARPPGPGNPNTPHILFDRMVRPLAGYGLRGAIWYQGESNAGAARLYRRQMRDLARDWQGHWEQGEFPFIQVQLAGYTPDRDFDACADWAFLREAQLLACGAHGLGMVSAIDAGEAGDIHPKDKKTVGERLAGWALAKTYRVGGVSAHGPVYAGMTRGAGGRLRLRFDGVGDAGGADGGLATRDGGAAVHTCRVAGANRQFFPAEARIEGDALVVWADAVPDPLAARYAWSANPERANLTNGAGLPASPFRTDTW